MRLEDQVISLESAKRLKELGIEHKSLFVWVSHFFALEPYLLYSKDKNHFPYNYWPAFTMAELFAITDLKNIAVSKIPSCLLVILDESNTQTEALAKILIYLIENNVIDKEAAT